MKVIILLVLLAWTIICFNSVTMIAYRQDKYFVHCVWCNQIYWREISCHFIENSSHSFVTTFLQVVVWGAVRGLAVMYQQPKMGRGMSQATGTCHSRNFNEGSYYYMYVYQVEHCSQYKAKEYYNVISELGQGCHLKLHERLWQFLNMKK